MLCINHGCLTAEVQVNAFIDQMLASEASLNNIAAKSASWPELLQAGPTLIPVAFPEDPNNIVYMTREQLETELTAHRRKKANLTQSQSRRPAQPRKTNAARTNTGKAIASPTVTDVNQAAASNAAARQVMPSPVVGRPMSPTDVGNTHSPNALKSPEPHRQAVMSEMPIAAAVRPVVAADNLNAVQVSSNSCQLG